MTSLNRIFTHATVSFKCLFYSHQNANALWANGNQTYADIQPAHDESVAVHRRSLPPLITSCCHVVRFVRPFQLHQDMPSLPFTRAVSPQKCNILLLFPIYMYNLRCASWTVKRAYLQCEACLCGWRQSRPMADARMWPHWRAT